MVIFISLPPSIRMNSIFTDVTEDLYVHPLTLGPDHAPHHQGEQERQHGDCGQLEWSDVTELGG